MIVDLRIVLGSVAPIVLRCVETEATLHGRTIDETTITTGRESLMKEISPIDDIRSTATYRLNVSANLLRDFLLLCRQRLSN